MFWWAVAYCHIAGIKLLIPIVSERGSTMWKCRLLNKPLLSSTTMTPYVVVVGLWSVGGGKYRVTKFCSLYGKKWPFQTKNNGFLYSELASTSLMNQRLFSQLLIKTGLMCLFMYIYVSFILLWKPFFSSSHILIGYRNTKGSHRCAHLVIVNYIQLPSVPWLSHPQVQASRVYFFFFFHI